MISLQENFHRSTQILVVGGPAGLAAAIALEEKCSPREIEAEKLQKALRKQGAVVTYEDI